MSLILYFLFPLRIEMDMKIPNFIDLSLGKAKAIDKKIPV
jgi:hypothetical protein